MKTTRSWFSMYARGGNIQLQIKKKIGENPLLVPFLFTGPIIYSKGMI